MGLRQELKDTGDTSNDLPRSDLDLNPRRCQHRPAQPHKHCLHSRARILSCTDYSRLRLFFFLSTSHTAFLERPTFDTFISPLPFFFCCSMPRTPTLLLDTTPFESPLPLLFPPCSFNHTFVLFSLTLLAPGGDDRRNPDGAARDHELEAKVLDLMPELGEEDVEDDGWR